MSARVISPTQFAIAFDRVVSTSEKKLRHEFYELKTYTDTFLRPGDGVLCTIADELGLMYHREVGRIDAILYEPVDGHRAVSVAVEHEHLAKTTEREAWALSMCNVPLKVLITYPEEAGEERLLLDKYASVLRATDTFNDFASHRKQLVIFGFNERLVRWEYYTYTSRGFKSIQPRP